MKIPFPFSAIVGQDEIKQAILLTCIDPSIGGILALGDRGTGKSTAIRALAALLPELKVVAGCVYGCDPTNTSALCSDCQSRKTKSALKSTTKSVPVIDLPLGATEDRVVGALDLERALSAGIKAFEPGLLAQANRGFLYIDEVNLLDDHLVDLLIDVAASGENLVERDGLSIRHPARFVLIGSGNPEEGELRPQLLDRFGLSVDIKTPNTVQERVEIIKRRDLYERDPETFVKQWQAANEKIKDSIIAGRKKLPAVEVTDAIHEKAAELCIKLGTDGLRGELTLIRTARALAAFEGKKSVSTNQLRTVAASALRHRLRRNPLDDSGSGSRVERAISEVFED
jgi:magnesium chelatase subunit I